MKIKKKMKVKYARKLQKNVRNIKLYFAYFKIKFLNEIQYKIAALAGILTQFAWGGMYLMLYSTFLVNRTETDYSIIQMSTYIWLQQSLYTLFNMWSVDKSIIEQCQTGNIAVELVKPVNLYSIWHAKTLGRKIALATLRFIPILVICTLPFLGEYRMMLPRSFTSFFLFLISLVLSVLLMMSYIMIMYSCVIKNISSQGIKITFQMIMEFCSGASIPIAFMPNVVIKILKCTPFYYMQNVAFNIYNGYMSDVYEIMKVIILQIVWLAILTIIGKVSINKQLNKIVVLGG